MSTTERHTTAAEDRVPWNQLIAYGMGGLIPIALFNIAGQLMGLLGNISLGLSAFWLGTIMIIPRLWDAFSDPIIGHLSDNTRTRWGRRRPYILIGGIAVALSFVAMWWVPRGEWIRDNLAERRRVQLVPTWHSFWAALLVFFTACAVFEIPHGALGLEMSTDYHERTRLFSAKSFLGNLFAMGTPWLIFLAGLEVFRGTGRQPGRRHAVRFDVHRGGADSDVDLVVPVAPGAGLRGRARAKEVELLARHADDHQQQDISESDVAIIFTLAMGFNFVGSFTNYITIFYLYGGDVDGREPAAGNQRARFGP